MDIIIPWRDLGCKYRKRNFEYTYNYYSKEYSVIVSDSNHKKFNRSAARNYGVNNSSSDIFCVVDADIIIEIDVLKQIENDYIPKNMIKPFKTIYYLNPENTKLFLENPKFDGYKDRQFYMPTGGAFITDKETWNVNGGMDESIERWGKETDNFIDDLDKNGINISYTDNSAIHLYHPAKRDDYFNKVILGQNKSIMV